MKQITSRDNPIVKQAASLKQNKYRRQEGLFLLEGERLIDEIILFGDRLVRYFVQEDLLEKYRWFIEKMGDEKCCLVNEKIIRSICDSSNPQGIVAVASIRHWGLETALERRGLWVMMDAVSDPGNLGTIIRSCWALGGQGCLLSPDCADPHSPKASRASMGGILNIPVIHGIAREDLLRLISSGYTLMGTSVKKALPYYQTDLSRDIVLLIGSEARGLGSSMMEICHEMLLIPMKEGVNSLNAASACAIILSEAMRQKSAC